MSIMSRICRRLTGHRWTRPTSGWTKGRGVLGVAWARETECRVCGSGFVEWQTWNPEKKRSPKRGTK